MVGRGSGEGMKRVKYRYLQRKPAIILMYQVRQVSGFSAAQRREGASIFSYCNYRFPFPGFHSIRFLNDKAVFFSFENVVKIWNCSVIHLRSFTVPFRIRNALANTYIGRSYS